MVDGCVEYRSLKKSKMENINNILVKEFSILLKKLEPKNIWLNGEVTNFPVSRSEVKKREEAIYNQWKDLESTVGRKVSEEEIRKKENG